MRLINTTTLELAEFVGNKVPPYAILSHRWASSSEELSLKEYRKGLKQEKSGYRKILDFCRLAASQDYEWGWIDTICIDKRSSAELSEAINSMFKWYKDAAICFAYLSDVKEGDDWVSSEWWTRGWTLQELIAPAEVLFFNASWNFTANKNAMGAEISSFTRIPCGILTGSRQRGGRAPFVAERMSWAAGRSTTRVEDRAYCLLGLFDVQMPLLYGEGDKAFKRLQLQILAKSPDDSILCWEPSGLDRHVELPSLWEIMKSPVLANSPGRFKPCGVMKSESQHANDGPTAKSAFTAPRATSWGLEIRGNAQRLYWTQRAYTANFFHLGEVKSDMWALSLVVFVKYYMEDKFAVESLPYALILTQHGPLSTQYRRYDCVQYDDILNLRIGPDNIYRLGEVESNKLFHLWLDDPDADPFSGQLTPTAERYLIR